MAAESPAGGARPTILCIDDDRLVLSMCKTVLEGRGYRVVVATNGQAGLALADKERPALILLDILMPGMDGFEVCRHLKATPLTAPIPVIVLTAVKDAALNHRAYEVGAMSCLTKPFRFEALLTVIQATIGSAERQRKRKMKAQGNGG